MGNILLVSENEDIITNYKILFGKKPYKFQSCADETSIYDYIEISQPDLIILDELLEFPDIKTTIKKIKSNLDNVQILLLTNGECVDEEISKLVSGFLFNKFSDNLIVSTINTYLKNS